MRGLGDFCLPQECCARCGTYPCLPGSQVGREVSPNAGVVTGLEARSTCSAPTAGSQHSLWRRKWDREGRGQATCLVAQEKLQKLNSFDHP